jgi:hypothetical protein
MRNRARGLIIALALVGLISAAAFARPSTAGQAPSHAKTYRLDWTFPVRVKGRLAIRAKIYWFRISPSHWSVRASVTNLSGHTLRPLTVGKTGWGWTAETTGVHTGRGDYQCGCIGREASSFKPALPHGLRPGARWSGTFSGTVHHPFSGFPWATFSLGYYNGWAGGFGFAPLRAVHIR